MEREVIQLTINDLQEIQHIIDLACTRGAFRGAEMRGVGETYDRISLFIQAIIDSASQAQIKGEEK